MIKLLVSELRAKDLVSPRYDSRIIVPGARHEVYANFFSQAYMLCFVFFSRTDPSRLLLLDRVLFFMKL